MPLIALFLVLALLYWLWPFILAISIAAAIYFIYKSERKRQIDNATRNCIEQNLAKVVDNISSLKSKYVGAYGTQKGNNLSIIKITDIKIEQIIGKKCLSFEMLRITPNGEIQDAPYQLGSSISLILDQKTPKIIEIKGEDVPGSYSLDWLLEAIGFIFAKKFSINLFDKVSVETELSELLFLNHLELQWATVAINKIEKALAPVSAAYGASLTNELLKGNQTYLLRAVEVMQKELNELQAYAQDSTDAMRKAYEFLNIPTALRNFEKLDTKPLQIYFKKKEMRDNFQAALGVKREYDDLKYP